MALNVCVLTQSLRLSELQSKIWNRQDGRSELFHEIEITFAHYKELQKRLTESKPGRISPNYSSADVQSIKLDILRSFKPPSLPPSLPVSPGCNDDEKVGVEQTEGGEDSDSLDDELRPFFPTTIQYLDLSSLELSNPPDRLPLPLLIREDYDVISELLDDLSQDSSGSMISNGQPGTGDFLIFCFLSNLT